MVNKPRADAAPPAASGGALGRKGTVASAPDPTRSVLLHSKSHPRMLKSNATSHVWPLGALAELLDNSQDLECGAERVDVDAYEVSPGTMALTVQDDGFGMHRGQLQNMLSSGFSNKEHVVGNVGRFGVGFKSGSMRLANDALILTRQEGTVSVALLSTTFLDAIGADDILIPMLTWKVEPGSLAGKHTYVALTPSNTAEWKENMGLLEEYTCFKSEQAMLAELDKIDTVTGTRVVLFNLKNPPEFDFEFDLADIRMMRSLGDDDDDDDGEPRTSSKPRQSGRRPIFQQQRPGQNMTLDVPEDYSLRSYMEVLYLRPTVAFTLRGKDIVPRCPIARLRRGFSSAANAYHRLDPYTPRGIPEARASSVHVHCGYMENNTRHCGFHIYNKNRLIQMYQRFGAQLQANHMMKDMLGVVEADCLEPTHNKQAFNTTDITYAKCKKHIEKSMGDYYFNVQKYKLSGFYKQGKRAVRGKRKGRDIDSDSDSINEETDPVDEDVGGNDGGGKKKSKPSAAAQRPKVGRVFPSSHSQHRVS